MSSLFSGINVALQAMLAHQQAIQVIEQNVANANTPGYHRQQAILTAGMPNAVMTMYNTFAGQMGSGVMVNRIQRFTTTFYDSRYREAQADAKQSGVESQALQEVESTMAETGDGGLVKKLDDFWAGWQTLSADPSNQSVRADLLQRSQSLVDGIKSRAQSLTNLQIDQNKKMVQNIQEINNLVTQIAGLNGQISRVLAINDQPNDLMDQRDQALDRVSELTGATSQVQDNGEVIVAINGHTMVNGQTANSLVASKDPIQMTISYSDGGTYSPTTGEMAGLVNTRDVIGQQISGLDTLAYNLVNAVNGIHNPPAGDPIRTNPPYVSASMDFFTSLTSSQGAASQISINPDISSNLSNIIGASSPNPEDGSIAKAIAGLQMKTQAGLGNLTLNDYYTNQAAQLGLTIQKYTQNATNQGQVADALNGQRESISGVSLDEEAANLATSQRAYDAAARLVNVLDEMLDKVINGMGLVGR